MKKSYPIAMVALLLVLLGSCASIQQVSRFNSQTVTIGMTKKEIVEKFGRPYKENFSLNSANNQSETLYYKEVLYKGFAGSEKFEVNSILHLENGKLISYEMGEEQYLPDAGTSVKVKEKH